MQAIVRTGGKQYRVKEGDIIKVEKLPGEIGSEIILDDILMVTRSGEAGTEVLVGTPKLPDFKIKGEILKQGKARKIVVFTYKRRKGEKKKMGHRQPYTAIKVREILGAEKKPAPLTKEKTEPRQEKEQES